jgi:hypothetical protein
VRRQSTVGANAAVPAAVAAVVTYNAASPTTAKEVEGKPMQQQQQWRRMSTGDIPQPPVNVHKPSDYSPAHGRPGRKALETLLEES